MEIVQTGELRRIDHEKTESVGVVRLFLGVYGVGEHNISHRRPWPIPNRQGVTPPSNGTRAGVEVSQI